MDPASVPLTRSAALTHWQWIVGAELAMTAAPVGLWWERDPQLPDRMGRR